MRKTTTKNKRKSEKNKKTQQQQKIKTKTVRKANRKRNKYQEILQSTGKQYSREEYGEGGGGEGSCNTAGGKGCMLEEWVYVQYNKMNTALQGKGRDVEVEACRKEVTGLEQVERGSGCKGRDGMWKWRPAGER